MCYIRLRPDYHDNYTEPPDPRPRPQLRWVIPVDAVDLGAKLEAYSAHLSQTTTLRLCHRFSDNALSRLPQEVLDQVITELHRVETAKCRPMWQDAFACFQGRCASRHHTSIYCEGDHEELWYNVFVINAEHSQNTLDPADYTLDQKADMLDEYFFENGDYSADYECAWEHHIEEQCSWVDRLCLCETKPVLGKKQPYFWELRKLLRANFGMDVIVLHEMLSSTLINHLSDITWKFDGCYHTACYISPVSETLHPTKAGCDRSVHHNEAFFKGDDHYATRQKVLPAQLQLSEEQKLRCLKAMRILELQPQYHRSELASLITENTTSEALWTMCNCQPQGCPNARGAYRRAKTKQLQHYLQAKNKELSKEAWPQLMVIATSNAVGPHSG